jgi:hypothetical protein
MGAADDTNTARSGTFIVSSADETAIVIQDVATTQVHTVQTSDLAAAIADHSPPAAAIGDDGELEPGTVLDETTLVPAADGVRWTVDTVGTVRWIPIERVDLEPTKRSRDTAREAETGDLTTHERAGEGAVHVLAVPPDRVAGAATDVVEDSATRRRAARLGVDRVEIRTGTTGAGDSLREPTDGGNETGVVSVRYLPD